MAKKSGVSRHPKIFNLKSNTMKKHSAKSVIMTKKHTGSRDSSRVMHTLTHINMTYPPNFSNLVPRKIAAHAF